MAFQKYLPQSSLFLSSNLHFCDLVVAASRRVRKLFHRTLAASKAEVLTDEETKQIGTQVARKIHEHIDQCVKLLSAGRAWRRRVGSAGSGQLQQDPGAERLPVGLRQSFESKLPLKDGLVLQKSLEVGAVPVIAQRNAWSGTLVQIDHDDLVLPPADRLLKHGPALAAHLQEAGAVPGEVLDYLGLARVDRKRQWVPRKRLNYALGR
mmetsp:Transcript_13660/g.50907  ORF Transcript_13660/g.50907 Transcript_13660/m.50907 type:complete len:208 (+) Transcript_13660:1487-2110(+)